MIKSLVKAIIFDMDGIVTKTALVHADAWKKAFDEYLKLREKRDGIPFKEFTHDDDYLPYVDGKPRDKGVESFLESRGITLPYGDSSDSGNKETICGLGNRKNELFRGVLEEQGVKKYEPMVEFIALAKKNGIKVGVASSSKNCETILEKAQILDLFETRVDGIISQKMGLKGKPEADIFTTAAKNLGVDPAEAVVVEDANSGVAAGRNGGFGLVLGVARKENIDQLFVNGADIVMENLSDMNIEWVERWFKRKPQRLFRCWKAILSPTYTQLWELNYKIPIYLNPSYVRTSKEVFFNNKKSVFFLDYDGTLTPIVDRPEMAVISEEMKATVKQLSEKYTVAIVSGRQREDVENLLGLKNLVYAGSHGFDIKGPGISMVYPEVEKIIPVINEVISRLKKIFVGIEGLLVEEKKFSVAVHYRLVDEKKYFNKIKSEVEKLVSEYDSLRLIAGKKVFELLPDMEWDKGKAVQWLVKAMGLDWGNENIIYLGDDITDENAFRMVRTRGAGILVAEKRIISTADFRLSSPVEVKELFKKLI